MRHPSAIPGADSAALSLAALKDATQATRRHTTRTAFPVDVGMHRPAIEATGRLRDAILAPDLEAATAALGRGARTDLEFVSFTPNDGKRLTHLTLLSLATVVDSQAHTVQMLPLLVASGANLRQADSSGRTLLHFADDTHVASWLLGHGADPGVIVGDDDDDVDDGADDSGHVVPPAALAVIAAWRLGEAIHGAEAAARPLNRL